MASIQLNDKRTLSIMEGINHGVVNVNGYIKSLGIKPQSFAKQVKKMSIRNPKLYDEYLERKTFNLEQFKKNTKEILLNVEDMIDNGVLLEDGSIREFDLLDWYYIYNCYFQNLTRIFLTELLNEIDNEVSVKKVVKTRQLLSRSYNDNLGCVNNEINSYHIINDRSYGLSDLEKNAIINYFNQNGIPYTYDSYHCAARRVINNREKRNEIDINVVNQSNHFDFVKDDIVKYNQLNEINKCFSFKIRKRIR